jgi:hypothetical protein
MEAIASIDHQCWGTAFLEKESALAETHEPYCANYIGVADVIAAEERALRELDAILDVRSQLPGYLAKPMHRVYSYTILLDALREAATGTLYSHLDQLDRAWVAARQLEARIDAAQQRASMSLTLSRLSSRFPKWDSLAIDQLGELLLVDTRNNENGEEYKCLFERAVLSFSPGTIRSASSESSSSESSSSLSSIGMGFLSRLWNGSSAPTFTASSSASYTLLLESYVFIADIVLVTPDVTFTPDGKREYALHVLWTRRNDPTANENALYFRNRELLHEWHTEINRLIRGVARGGDGSDAESVEIDPGEESPIVRSDVPLLQMDELSEEEEEATQEELVGPPDATLAGSLIPDGLKEPSIKSQVSNTPFSQYLPASRSLSLVGDSQHLWGRVPVLFPRAAQPKEGAV